MRITASAKFGSPSALFATSRRPRPTSFGAPYCTYCPNPSEESTAATISKRHHMIRFSRVSEKRSEAKDRKGIRTSARRRPALLNRPELAATDVRLHLLEQRDTR